MLDKNLHDNTSWPIYIDYKDENPDAPQSPNEPKDLSRKEPQARPDQRQAHGLNALLVETAK